MTRIKDTAGSVKKFASTRKAIITMGVAAVTAAGVVLVMRHSKAEPDLGSIYDIPSDHSINE